MLASATPNTDSKSLTCKSYTETKGKLVDLCHWNMYVAS